MPGSRKAYATYCEVVFTWITPGSHFDANVKSFHSRDSIHLHGLKNKTHEL